jgi:hypothetical protein
MKTQIVSAAFCLFSHSARATGIHIIPMQRIPVGLRPRRDRREVDGEVVSPCRRSRGQRVGIACERSVIEGANHEKRCHVEFFVPTVADGGICAARGA